MQGQGHSWTQLKTPLLLNKFANHNNLNMQAFYDYFYKIRFLLTNSHYERPGDSGEHSMLNKLT